MIKKTILVAVMAVVVFGLKAQEEKTYTDEELTLYATVMAWAETEKDRMTGVYNDWINNNEDLDAPRFLDIKNAGGDSLKLVELEATETEVMAYSKIIANYDSMTSSFKDVYVGKIKDDIGAGLYNSLRKDLKSNEELKARYEAILAEVMKEMETKGEDESEE